jgi:uracil permease
MMIAATIFADYPKETRLTYVKKYYNAISLFRINIPTPVMGGISIILFGMISSVGVRTLIEAEIDFAHSRNLIIASLIFVLGIAIGNVTLWGSISLSGLAVAAIIGVVLNKVLPKNI